MLTFVGARTNLSFKSFAGYDNDNMIVKLISVDQPKNISHFCDIPGNCATTLQVRLYQKLSTYQLSDGFCRI